MASVCLNQGENVFVKCLLNHTAPQNLSLRLFTNDITPAETNTNGNYAEASGSGYAAKTITGSSWTVVEGAPTQASYAVQTFTFTAAHAAIYGYFLSQTSSGVIVIAERFTDGPYTIVQSGDEIRITLAVTLD
jgi:hypothetical protein